MKIGITADCSSGVEYAPFKHNIKITRTTINMGDQVLVDGVDITADEFYQKLETVDYVPTTAAPSIGEVAKRALEWKEEGCTDVIHFPISNGLSTYGINMAQMGEDVFSDIPIHFFPTRQVCIMQGYLAHYAEILASHGKTVEEIFAACEKFQNQMTSYFVVDDLKYLMKNGRLKAIPGIIGTIISIKPILHINEEGKIVPLEKVRTKARALDHIKDIVEADSANCKKCIVAVLHANRLAEAESVAEDLRARLKSAVRVEVGTITPTVGAHIGSGLVGACCLSIDDLEYQDEI